MDMCYDGVLVMPCNYTVMSDDEMTYVEGGWCITPKVKKTKGGIPIGVYLTLTATVADMAWITGAGVVFTAAVGALCANVPVIGPILAGKGFQVGCAFVAFAATVIATNDKANKKKFSITKYIGV